MLLTITTTHNPATDLGYLLHKSPFRCQSFELSFGKVHVFYPEVTSQKCTVGKVRGNRGSGTGVPLNQYVNDRPYVASSFMSVAIARVFGTAMKGVCKERPDLEKTVMPLSARIAVLPALQHVFDIMLFARPLQQRQVDMQTPSPKFPSEVFEPKGT